MSDLVTFLIEHACLTTRVQDEFPHIHFCEHPKGARFHKCVARKTYTVKFLNALRTPPPTLLFLYLQFQRATCEHHPLPAKPAKNSNDHKQNRPARRDAMPASPCRRTVYTPHSPRVSKANCWFFCNISSLYQMDPSSSQSGAVSPCTRKLTISYLEGIFPQNPPKMTD